MIILVLFDLMNDLCHRNATENYVFFCHNFSTCTKDCHVSIKDVFVPSAEMMKCAINLVARINSHVFQENA